MSSLYLTDGNGTLYLAENVTDQLWSGVPGYTPLYRLTVQDQAEAPPDEANNPLPLRVDRFVVGDGEEQVMVTWKGNGWEVAAVGLLLLDVHRWVAADDINDTDEALAVARDLVVDVRQLAQYRRQAEAAEKALLAKAEPPF